MTDENTDETDNEEYWWGHPHDARRYHVFEEKRSMARSLCGNWMLGHDGRDPDVDPESDTYTEGEDCKKCARKAGVLDA